MIGHEMALLGTILCKSLNKELIKPISLIEFIRNFNS
jgi:hypothetical protein